MGCASGSSLRLRLSPLRLEARVRPARSPLTSALFRPADGALWFGTADGSLLQLSTRSRIFFGLAELMGCRGSECSPSPMPPPPPLPLQSPPSPAPLPAPPPPSLLPPVPTPTQPRLVLQQHSFQQGGKEHTLSLQPQLPASTSIRFDPPDALSAPRVTPALWISQRAGLGMTIVLVRSASPPCPRAACVPCCLSPSKHLRLLPEVMRAFACIRAGSAGYDVWQHHWPAVIPSVERVHAAPPGQLSHRLQEAARATNLSAPASSSAGNRSNLLRVRVHLYLGPLFLKAVHLELPWKHGRGHISSSAARATRRRQ